MFSSNTLLESRKAECCVIYSVNYRKICTMSRLQFLSDVIDSSSSSSTRRRGISLVSNNLKTNTKISCDLSWSCVSSTTACISQESRAQCHDVLTNLGVGARLRSVKRSTFTCQRRMIISQPWVRFQLLPAIPNSFLIRVSSLFQPFSEDFGWAPWDSIHHRPARAAQNRRTCCSTIPCSTIFSPHH